MTSTSEFDGLSEYVVDFSYFQLGFQLSLKFLVDNV